MRAWSSSIPARSSADACSESIETILGEAQKGGPAGARLIVTGCLVDRYGDELAGLLPEVDAFVGRDACGSIEQPLSRKRVSSRMAPRRKTPRERRLPRKVLTPLPTAYLQASRKGATTAAATAPYLPSRGLCRAGRVDDIEEEFARLLGRGYREFNVIGQDITSLRQGLGHRHQEAARAAALGKGRLFHQAPLPASKRHRRRAPRPDSGAMTGSSSTSTSPYSIRRTASWHR